ncbi:MAG: nitroreductase family protein [Flavobacteriales bacterium]|nr:nitroreductase family protein [Flavobacteriales bacterium]MCB9174547.1 nitroreductase family protein [Flavobacteriales bacterium]
MAEKFIPYQRKEYSPEEQLKRSQEYFLWSNERRTVREFSDRPVDIKVIENIIKAASTAPSGANKQPWTFCVVSSPEMKKKIREAAEIEEKENYSGRMSERWIKDLEHFDTNWEKPFLETAPYLIVVCKRAYEMEEGEKVNNYYVTESVGLAAGMLLSAIHHAGLVSLTHTPSPMNFLTKVLNRPENERPFLLIPVGYAAENAKVPNIGRKELNEVMIKYE